MTDRREPREFFAGVLAALAMLVAMGGLRLASGVLSLPEMLGEGFIRLLPAEVFSKLLDTLQHAAKPALEIGIILGQLAVGGLLGRIYGRAPSWSRALAIVATTWIVVGVLVLPLLRLGLFGSAFRAGPMPVAASLLAVFLVFGTALVLFHRLFLPAAPEESAALARLTRRATVVRLGLGVVALAIGGYGWRAFSSGAPAPRAPSPGGRTTADPGAPARPLADTTQPRAASLPAPGEPGSGPFALNGLSPEVTPTKDFYTVSKNFFDPSVETATWSLTLDGLIERPMTLSYDQIRTLPAVSDFYTLQCISNPVGGDLWGNAHWRGVRLVDLLQQVGLKPGIRKVVFHAADDYTDSVTLERALNSGALLAYEMNGAPLEKEHGYPARLLIPGIYGMKNVKWVTRIELVDFDFKGYWMQQGWSDSAPYKTSSRIDVPANRTAPAAGVVPIAGVAFAGDRGIRAVEYSLDNGQSWQPAELKPPLATNTWQLWVARPDLAPGRYTIRVRATDGKGELQTEKEADPLPDGASGYHTVIVGVA